FPLSGWAVSDSPQYDSGLPLASRSAGRPVAPAACVSGGGPGVTLPLLSDTHSEEPHASLPPWRQSGGATRTGGIYLGVTSAEQLLPALQSLASDPTILLLDLRLPLEWQPAPLQAADTPP